LIGTIFNKKDSMSLKMEDFRRKLKQKRIYVIKIIPTIIKKKLAILKKKYKRKF